MFVGYIEGYVENKVTVLCWMIVFAKKKIAKRLMLFVLIKVFTPLINQLNTQKVELLLFSSVFFDWLMLIIRSQLG